MASRRSAVKAPLTYETADYAAMMRRMIRSYGRRLADGDPSDVADALALARDLDRVIGDAIRNGRAHHGFTWQQYADEIGVTRQAVFQRFGGTSV